MYNIDVYTFGLYLIELHKQITSDKTILITKKSWDRHK